jgi:DNA-binding response OmpR family regulator
MNQKILVVDDDPHILHLLASYLHQAGYQVTNSSNGKEAWQIICDLCPDLILLDIALPLCNGWEVTQMLRNHAVFKFIPVIMVTAKSEDKDKVFSFGIGADDYVTKPFSPHEVVARIRALLRRTNREIQPPAFLHIGSLRLDCIHHTATLDNFPLPLTLTEFRILQTLAEYPGHAFTRREIINRILGCEYEGLLDRTLDSHIKNLRRKIESPVPKQIAIETIYGVGFRLREQEGQKDF